MMNLQDAENMALAHMEDNGLSGWSFGFDRAKRRCGACFYAKKTITLSRYFVSANGASEVRDTVLHEIAHALAGAKAGHGTQWQMWAIRIGARPERCALTAEDCYRCAGYENLRDKYPNKG